MEKLFGILAIAALGMGLVEVLQFIENETIQDAFNAAAYVGSGLSCLAIYEIIKVLKQIRDGEKTE